MAEPDELLALEIERLEASLQEKRNKRAEFAPEVREAKKQYEKLELLLAQVRESYNKAATAYQRSNESLRKLDDAGKEEKAKLDALKRERDRLLDAKQINEKYQAQVDEFKSKCLESVWRSENRTDGLGAKPHQIDGAVHLAITERALLGDSKGLGKTLTSLITMDLKDAQKIIAVVPADTVDNWVREVKLWAPHRFAVPLYGMNKGESQATLTLLKRIPQFILILNYESWAADYSIIDELVKLKCESMIVDESHNIMNSGSLRNKGVQDIRYGINTCPKCTVPILNKKFGHGRSVEKEYECWCGYKGPITDFCSITTVLEMTGTPILNKPQELYPQLRLIDIERWPSERFYLRDHCYRDSNGRWQWQDGAEKEVVELIGPRYLARDKDTAGVILPPVGEIVHTITMDELLARYPRQHEAYYQIREHAEIALDPEHAMPMTNQMTALMRMRQVLTWPAAIQYKFIDPETEHERLLRLDVEESWRIDLAEQQIRELNESGERCIVFSQFTDGIHELARRLGPRTAVYDGSASPSQRTKIKLDFDAKTVPDKPAFDNVVSIYKSGGTGLNFNTCTHEFLLDREWNPGKEDQAIGRMQRIGASRDMYVHKFFVEKSVDYFMDDIIQMKKGLVGGFMSEAEVLQNAFDRLRNGEM